MLVDGFDIDNKRKATAFWPDFPTRLRSCYAATSRKFYINATLRCPRLDASIPASVMQVADFVSVQIYNNPLCDPVSGSGFLNSIGNWSTDLKGYSPKIFIGAPAWSGGGQGYVPPNYMSAIVSATTARVASAGNNSGVITVWDGAVGAGTAYNSAAAKAA